MASPSSSQVKAQAPLASPAKSEVKEKKEVSNDVSRGIRARRLLSLEKRTSGLAVVQDMVMWSSTTRGAMYELLGGTRKFANGPVMRSQRNRILDQPPRQFDFTQANAEPTFR